jgi:hypothetical protein
MNRDPNTDRQSLVSFAAVSLFSQSARFKAMNSSFYVVITGNLAGQEFLVARAVKKGV